MSGCRARAANRPPAPISGSCAGSPTRTSVPPAARVRASSSARVRVSAMEASSTTSTPPAGRPIGSPVASSVRRIWASSRASDDEVAPVACSSRRAVTAATAPPSTGRPWACPDPDRSRQGRGLARAGRADHHRQPGCFSQRADHRELLVRQLPPRRRGAGHVIGDPAPRCAPKLVGDARGRPVRHRAARSSTSGARPRCEWRDGRRPGSAGPGRRRARPPPDPLAARAGAPGRWPAAGPGGRSRWPAP